MSVIKVDDLSVAGAEFFFDSESYLNELSEGDAITIKGGLTPGIVVSFIVATIILANPPKVY